MPYNQRILNLSKGLAKVRTNLNASMSLWHAQVQVCGFNGEVLEIQGRGYSVLQIAYFEEVPPRKDGGESFIDGRSECIVESSRGKPKFHIGLPIRRILIHVSNDPRRP